MKNITNNELELLVKNLINGKITRKALAKTLNTDIRTLHKVILQISETNPELYEEYVEKFPYKPKTREDIDYEALIIYAVKREKTLKEVSLEFGVSYRTINRRIKEIQGTNPELISLYKEHSYHLKTEAEISYESQIKIDALEERPVIKATVTQHKENELREILRKFEELLRQGFSKAEAGRKLGYADHTAIWKKYRELKRIETEKRVKPTRTFKDSLKLTGKIKIIPHTKAPDAEIQIFRTQNETPEEEK